MLLLNPVAESKTAANPPVPAIARFLPSMTDIAFLMPLIFVFGKLAGARTLLGDGDTGWHIRTGEWILAHGAVPKTDFFSFSRPGAPWFAWEWLWDVAFAALHQRWGMAAVVAASLGVICLTNAMLFRLIRRASGNSLVATCVSLLATGGCAVHWLARPHLFTLLFFTLTLHITMRAAEGRTGLLKWLVPLTLLWTNIHGGFFVVLLVLGSYIASDLINASIATDAEARRSLIARTRPWIQVFAACFAVTFINPYGWNLHRHVIEYLTDPYQLQHISEFQSMNFHAPVTFYLEPLMFLSIATALWDMRNRRFADAFLSLGWLHLALVAQRNIPLFMIAASPSAARALTALLRRAAAGDRMVGWISRLGRWFADYTVGVELNERIPRLHLASVLPLLGVAAILVLTPPRAGVIDAKFISTYDPKSYPEKALPVLLSAETNRIFAEDEWGDYLIYHLYPSKQVFVDGRSDFYGDEFGLRYLDVLNVQHGWQKTLDRYGVDTIAISPRQALASTLKLSQDWKVVYDDTVTLVFRRLPSAPASLVTSNGGLNRDLAIAKPNKGSRKAGPPNT